MTDKQALEITEGLDALILALDAPSPKALRVELLLTMQQAGQALRDHRAALSRPATPAAGDAEVERVRIVAWLRDHECSGLIREEPFDEAADAIERGDHHA